MEKLAPALRRLDHLQGQAEGLVCRLGRAPRRRRILLQGQREGRQVRGLPDQVSSRHQQEVRSLGGDDRQGLQTLPEEQPLMAVVRGKWRPVRRSFPGSEGGSGRG